MLTIAITAAAVGLTVPSPANSLTVSDYPTWAVARGVSGASLVHMAIDPAGRITECRSVQTFGNRQLAEESCRILKRKRFNSPTLDDGQKVHAFLETVIKFFLPDTAEGRKMMALRNLPDAELSVNRLPNGPSANVSISLVYGQDGRIASCKPSSGEREQALAGIACGQRAMFEDAVKHDASGRPVPYVTSKMVRFSVSVQQK